MKEIHGKSPKELLDKIEGIEYNAEDITEYRFEHLTRVGLGKGPLSLTYRQVYSLSIVEHHQKKGLTILNIPGDLLPEIIEQTLEPEGLVDVVNNKGSKTASLSRIATWNAHYIAVVPDEPQKVNNYVQGDDFILEEMDFSDLNEEEEDLSKKAAGIPQTYPHSRKTPTTVDPDDDLLKRMDDLFDLNIDEDDYSI